MWLMSNSAVHCVDSWKVLLLKTHCVTEVELSESDIRVSVFDSTDVL